MAKEAKKVANPSHDPRFPMGSKKSANSKSAAQQKGSGQPGHMSLLKKHVGC